METIIDVSQPCGDRAGALKASGIATVIRYYSRDTINPSKRLTRSEAEQHAAAGLRLAVVHEGRFGDQANNFNRDCGVIDAASACDYAVHEIGQPAGSTIYFAVDVDASATEIRDHILPYFRGIADTFAYEADHPRYQVGVYGSGATCKAVLDAGLAQRAWLAQSTGWSGYSTFLKGKNWALSQAMPSNVAGVSCDPNTACDGGLIGDFTIEVVPEVGETEAAAIAKPMRVNARHGLHLRPGPGEEFDWVRTLPYGTLVHPMRAEGSWTLVDVDGDGAADGFVSGAYLAEVTEGARDAAKSLVSPLLSQHIPDAVHIPELIRQGETAAGLKAARLAATAALRGYPHNGCAAHLSALLRDSGITVPITWGAGKLAYVLAQRGWGKISVGSQQAGDVGVCYDNDPTPAGADHIYLVVETLGPDEMMIADNQRTADAPHARFASGHGKTPTEYFLRAC